ncbi:S-Ena type endospore appendage [Gracilibacillus xinjiangensis]|uniref:S-Ena type endospore appendage n=1 Tax=Gracilibacillus xinjiangensis TaxID=1193282 RepID=A0ABV8X0E3_9BACI
MGNICSCCSNGCVDESCDFVMDQICTGWSVSGGTSQDIYVATEVAVFGSGYLAYDEGTADFVTFRFLNGATPVGNTLTVYEGSSVAFTSMNFDRIQVTVPPGGVTDISSGQICITPRYQVECDL